MLKVIIIVAVVFVAGYFIVKAMKEQKDKNEKIKQCNQMCSSKSPQDFCPMCQGQDMASGVVSQDCLKCMQNHDNNVETCMNNCKHSN